MPFNILLLKFINELNIDFRRIKENLKRYELNKTIQFHESIELTQIYNKYKNTFEDKFQIEEKNLKDIVQKIIKEENNEKYYKIFVKKINEFISCFEDLVKGYNEKISKSYKTELEKYSIKSIQKSDDYLISIEYIGAKKDFWKLYGGITGVDSVLIGGLCLFEEVSITSFGIGLISGLIGGIILIGIVLIGGAGVYLIRKGIQKYKRANKIKKQFKVYFDKLDFIKKKILNMIDEIYKNTFNDIRIYKISQQKPMINIYNNNKSFDKIQKEFQSICIEINNK